MTDGSTTDVMREETPRQLEAGGCGGKEMKSNAHGPSLFVQRTLRNVGIGALLIAGVQGCAVGDEPMQASGGAANDRGKTLYLEHCASCHKPDGKGYVMVIPPLANSDYIAADVNRVLSVVVDGLSGPITVNGMEYNGVMPPLNHLSDEDLAAVLNYVVRQLSGQDHEFTAQQIGEYRARGRDKNAAAQK
jgi:mono/diheme cytochrome c family protein